MAKWQKRKSSSAFIGVFTFVVVVVIVAALFLGLWLMLDWLVPDEGASFIISLIAAALAIVYQITNTRIIERKLPIEQERRATRAQVYEKLLKGWFNALHGQNDLAEQGLLAACQAGKQDVLVYGSDKVVHYFGDFLNLGRMMDAEGLSGAARSERILASFSALLTAMREDVGHDSGQLESGNLARMIGGG